MTVTWIQPIHIVLHSRKLSDCATHDSLRAAFKKAQQLSSVKPSGIGARQPLPPSLMGKAIFTIASMIQPYWPVTLLAADHK